MEWIEGELVDIQTKADGIIAAIDAAWDGLSTLEFWITLVAVVATAIGEHLSGSVSWAPALTAVGYAMSRGLVKMKETDR